MVNLGLENTAAYINICKLGYIQPAKNKIIHHFFLMCVRFAKTDDVYIKTRCAAEMSKKLIYEIDISLDKNSEIMECQCDCGAGMGPSTHCKLVFC